MEFCSWSFARRIREWLRFRINLLALGVCAVFFLSLVIVINKLYYFMVMDAEDMAGLTQSLWSIFNGDFFNSIYGGHIFVEHCSFLCFFLAPFYWINPDPLLSQYFKLAAFFIGAYVFFLILKKRLNPFVAFWAMVAYIIAPANLGMLQFAFNYEPFSIPLVFLIFKSLDDRNYKLYIVFLFLLAMVKEQMPLVVVSFGILAFFLRKEDRIKWALVPIIMGIVIFVWEVFIFIPSFRKDFPIQEVYYWKRYAQFGDSPLSILTFILTHPVKILEQCFSSINTKWYNELFSVWGCLSFFSPQFLLPALPLFLKTLLSNAIFERQVFSNYYASTFTPFIFLAAWNTLDYVKNKWRLKLHWLAIFIMMIHALLFIPYWRFAIVAEKAPGFNNKLIAEYVFRRIPPEASVLASNSLLLPLVNRKHLYSLSTYLKGYYDVSRLKFDLTDNVEYMIMNLTDQYIFLKSESYYYLIPKMTALNFDDRWKIDFSLEDIALYSRNNSNRDPVDRLIEKSYLSFKDKDLQAISLDNSVGLQAVELKKELARSSRIFPLTLYWKNLNKTNIFYGKSVKVISQDGKVLYKSLKLIGSIIYPTYSWQKDEYIKEKYVHLLPHLNPGKYSLEVSIYNPLTLEYSQKMMKDFIVL